MRIEVCWLSLRPGSRVLMDGSVQQLYVEYLLPGVPPQDTETPVSLRKPREGEKIHFNFSRVIHLDPECDGTQREFLSSLLEGSDPNRGRLKFTVVSEPLDGSEEECTEVGFTYVPIRQIHQTGQDIVEKEFDILEVGQETEVIGKMGVSVEGAVALRAIYTAMAGALTLEGRGHRAQRAGASGERSGAAPMLVPGGSE